MTPRPTWRFRSLAAIVIGMVALLRWRIRSEGVEHVPVQRGSASGRAGALQAAVTALREGHLVMVAPEGRISPSFELEPFRTGAARMAQLAGVPVVPTASWGSQLFSTTGHLPGLRRSFGLPVGVRFGAPVAVGPDADVRAASEELRDRTAALLEELQRTHPVDAPDGAWWVPARLGGGAPPQGEG